MTDILRQPQAWQFWQNFVSRRDKGGEILYWNETQLISAVLDEFEVLSKATKGNPLASSWEIALRLVKAVDAGSEAARLLANL